MQEKNLSTPPETQQDAQDTSNPANDSAIHKFAALIVRLNALAHGLDPVANYFPDAAPKLHTVESILDIAERFITELENTHIDGATFAAKQISISTGDVALDARLAALDMHTQEVAPLLPLIRLVLKKLGVD